MSKHTGENKMPEKERRSGGVSMFEMGRLTQAVETLSASVIELKGSVEEMREDISDIQKERAKEKGIYRGMVIIATAIGSMITFAFQFVSKKLGAGG